MRTLTLTVTALLSLGACSGSSDGGAGDDTDKYTQTWAKSYSATSCSEWNGVMSEEQQFAAAADMLAGARNRGDGGTGLPDDSLIEQFQGGVTTACVEPTANVAEIGAVLYLSERAIFSP
jgi:hypothetical protein